MDKKKLTLTIKRTTLSALLYEYSLYANDIVISQSSCASWVVSQALQLYFCDPHIYVLDKKLSSIFKLLNASFDEKDKN